MIENKSFRLKELSKLTNLQMTEIINILNKNNYNLSLNPNLKLTEEQVGIINEHLNSSTKSTSLSKEEKISLDNTLVDNIKKYSVLNLKESKKNEDVENKDIKYKKNNIKNNKDIHLDIDSENANEEIDNTEENNLTKNDINDNYNLSFKEKITNNPIVNDYNEDYVDDSGLFKIYGSIDTNKYNEIKRNRPTPSVKNNKNDKNRSKLKNKDNNDLKNKET